MSLQPTRDLMGVHTREQVWRIFRLTAVAFGAQLAALGPAHMTRDALIGAGIAAAEAVYRQITPAAPLREYGAWIARAQKRVAKPPEVPDAK